MSLHVIKPEIEARLRYQRRNSFISSSVIGFLTVVLLMLLLSFLLLSPLFQESPTIVTYQTETPPEEEQTERKINNNVERKPSAPSSAMARVIAANTQSTVAVPVSDTPVTAPSVDFGDGDDFGDGWGDGDGSGGGATFFNQRVKAKRIAYVIDFSQSMNGPREKLMRKELHKSISGLSASITFQMIFFAGPSWVAGNQVDMPKGRRSATVVDDRKKFDWICGGKAHEWKPKGNKQQPGWLAMDGATLDKSLSLIRNTPLVWGTNWEPALTMALAMDPPPEVVFFMTDGLTGGDSEELAKTIGNQAKSKRITINTVAMMEPRAEKAMKDLAKRTGGQFTIIEEGGKIRQVPLN